jgi:hypothetical protein
VLDVPAQCVALADKLVRAGQVMFVGGALFGPDRTAGVTKYGYGDDRVAATALVIEVAADIAGSAVELMDRGRTYSAGALLRQLIECEYLVTLFGRDVQAAREWLNADENALRTYWSPAKMRARSRGAFRASEYRSHCQVGGHPSPKARVLLASHSMAVSPDHMWADLALHLDRLWGRIEEAAETLGYARPLARSME